ncbi:transposase [Polycladidibacter stylochi]|uniref:transposase n=1 Tax=Polycladidibacter stylochi TaxID=1807766 RepID=UPI00082F8BC3|nr:transposase [Pseudovibrio stylochi]
MCQPIDAEVFKREAVRLVEVSGRKVDEIAGELGIATVILESWQRELQGGGVTEVTHKATVIELPRSLRLLAFASSEHFIE